MKQTIKEFRKRRYERLLNRLDAEDKGSWITTENGHKVHLNEEGVPDKGNPKIVEVMNGGVPSGGSNKQHELSQRLNEELKNKNKYGVIGSFRDYVSDMKIGDTVECKNYKTGEVMKFKKLSNNNTIAAFKDLNGKNVMASPAHVEGWMKDSILYADYVPKFE